MKLNAYSIFDIASGVYNRPIFAQRDAQAIRMFGDETIRAESEINNHPEDYSLHKIGSYDDNKGKLEGHPPECLTTALEMVSRSREIEPHSLKEVK